jgi:hypothetical protein
MVLDSHKIDNADQRESTEGYHVHNNIADLGPD